MACYTYCAVQVHGPEAQCGQTSLNAESLEQICLQRNFISFRDQASRMGGSHSKTPDSLMAFKQVFLKTVLGEKVIMILDQHSWTFF